MNNKGSVLITKENHPVAFPVSDFSSMASAIARNYLQVRCAWCGIELGFKPANGATQQGISHGMCSDCLARIG